MSTLPFLGEIQIFAFGFAQQGYALADGQLLPINQNQALFSLLGTVYGGNGSTNFALPNLRGRVVMHEGNGHSRGEAGGSTSVTINISQLPTHLHGVTASDANADVGQITGARLAVSNNLYLAPSALEAAFDPDHARRQ